MLIAGFFFSVAFCNGQPVEKIKNKEDKKIVRQELSKQYDKFVKATMEKDSVLACSLVHPGSKTTMPSGEIWDAQKTCEYMTASFRQVQKTYEVSFDLDTIQANGDSASVLIHQHWHRSQMKGGKIRDVETTADQWETWVKKDGVYLRCKIDRIVPKIWRVDGKRIDPSKPYDPDAPEYAPTDSKKNF
jgi:hypothetical protein